jgi:hypothetical protein
LNLYDGSPPKELAKIPKLSSLIVLVTRLVCDRGNEIPILTLSFKTVRTAEFACRKHQHHDAAAAATPFFFEFHLDLPQRDDWQQDHQQQLSNDNAHFFCLCRSSLIRFVTVTNNPTTTSSIDILDTTNFFFVSILFIRRRFGSVQKFVGEPKAATTSNEDPTATCQLVLKTTS